ncbi:MAG: ricin-type beta-trefoil lectin domain protein, partial [Streptomyces sp.]|nr:ricin-type beta-trefoil lectin domain protein [Streptomyces sp.]
SAARQLAAQAFTLAARRTAHGTDHGEPWRHHLLLTATRAAARWAADERAAGLDPGLLPVLDSAGPDGPVPPMLTAYRSLPSRARGLLWYGVLDRVPADRAATLLGLTPADIAYDTAAALQALGRARLRSRLTASDDPSCPDFQRLIEESVRPDSPRHSADLTAHMADCAHCAAAYDELSALFDAPHTALAEGLLPWAGTAYALREPEAQEPPPGPGTATAAPTKTPAGPRHSAPRPSSGASAVSAADGPLTASAVSAAGGPLSIDRTWPPSRRLALASAALGVALAPLLVLLLPPDTPSAERAAHPVTRTPAPPPTPTTASPATKSPSPTRSPSPSPSPSQTRSPSPVPPPTTPRPTPTPTPPPVFRPPDSSYAQVVNVSTGRCLDIPGRIEKGGDVGTAACDGSRTQRWRVDAARGVVQSAADPDFCLDSRGSVDRGVGIWPCASVEGRNGRNLQFVVDDAGRIRPAIAVETAVTPAEGGHGLWLTPLDGGPQQRWRAGAD